MPMARCNGLRIHYEERGSGPLLLFLHGVGCGWQSWNPQLKALSDSFHTVAWDARGYGSSDDPPTPITQRDFAADANALLDHLGVDQAHICGLSMGGMIAQEIYRQGRARVRSLVLADTLLGFASLPNKDEVLADRLKALDDESFIEAARARAPMLFSDNADPALIDLMADHMAGLRPETYRQAWVSAFEVDNRGLLPTIEVPTLIICGREDTITPVANSEELHRGIHGSKLVIIEGAGHLCNLERPDEFTRIVRKFVLEVERQAEVEGRPG